ncbi:MAG: hypothetical protein KJ558_13905 [Gammaproteobacteria bacterium]|nr:hypothetical protein [Gammaproteobacteria bacterium]MBU1655887.1 hypothetical protein [Gammaproteobacteria bacterium]MBU1961016.1 hypothetical protein [Gammaproteobacteria bacterium]
MLNTAGLSLDQAPPVQVPLRFFLAAPFHLLMAGIIIALTGGDLGSRWAPSILASVHLVALGFMSQIMLGALLQLLPVIAGLSLRWLEQKSFLLWLLLNLGVPLMALGFLLGHFHLLALGASLVSLAAIPFILVALLGLLRLGTLSFTLKGIAFALGIFLLAICYGLFLVAVLNNWLQTDHLIDHVDTHATLALAGWLCLLVMSLALQLVPLFFVTGEFPGWFGRGVAYMALALLLLLPLLVMMEWDRSLALYLLALMALTYATLFIRQLLRRGRKTLDPVIFYWHAAAASLFLAGLSLLIGGQGEVAAALVLLGVGVVMPSGTLLKIIPFLSWFQLQNRQALLGRFVIRVPHMNSFIDAKSPWLLLILLILLLPGPILAMRGIANAGLLSGLLLMACALLQIRMFGGAYALFLRTDKKILEAQDSAGSG